uniref:GP-PDE domain-containing protein n=1 Tax=Ditylum brightwellii TaxID=49249 RepID=A0A6V2A5L0_9STRA|mmetsp:Transcript_36339/g.48719  ORF Transcript_36339/g.48719 Transcript_36339/m.48719 type:complete len:554 (+) Transcript_36339:183-1844(+)
MVKFGRHLQFFLEFEQPAEEHHYVVPYNDLREYITHRTHIEFECEWRNSLRASSDDYVRSTTQMWHRIFRAVACHPESRGATQDIAIRLYVSLMGTHDARELLRFMKSILSVAVMNSEALRKLVKKFDKSSKVRCIDGESVDDDSFALSSTLLPEVYSSIFTTGQASLRTCIDQIRALLDEDDDDSVLYGSLPSQNEDERAVRKRADELSWLHKMISSLPETNCNRLVAHRGFHSIKDRSDRRPLENSLSAYEAAWTAGVGLCECDVALTKDEKIVLAHDEDFSRLALNSSHVNAKRLVRDLTMKEIIALTFKSGTRPPLLIDVLRSACAIGGHAKLIIEIKAGNTEMTAALARMLKRHPDLAAHVEAIMSFDLWAMHKLKMELEEIFHSHHHDSNSSIEEEKKSGDCKESDSLYNPSTPPMPKLLLLTVADQPKRSYELWLNITGDLTPLTDQWLVSSTGGVTRSLDGVYLRYQKDMHSPAGISALKKLREQGYVVGVWCLASEDPDDYKTLDFLGNECGVNYYNTDLPRSFAKSSSSLKSIRSSSSMTNEE